MASGQWWIIGYLPITGAAQYVVFHGTQAQAQAKAQLAVNGTLHGPYATQSDAQAAIKNLPRNLQQTPTGAEQAIQNATGLTGLAAIGDFFSRLGQASTWIRVAEVLLGLGLIIVGLAKLASGTAVGRAAMKAGKAAALL